MNQGHSKKYLFHVMMSHPFGNANVRGVLQALSQAERLDQFWTTVGISERQKLSFLPSSLKREIHRRSYPLHSEQICLDPWREIARHCAERLGIQSWTQHETGWASIDQVWASLDRTLARRISQMQTKDHIVYAYEDGALETFRAARKKGFRCIYDLPIGYWKKAREIYRNEREMNPEFASILGGVQDSDEKCAKKEEEVSLADRIIACSPFVKNSLIDYGIEPSKVKTVQFGAPQGIPVKSWKAFSPGEKLRVLFVGRVDQRKGIGYLLRAVKSLGAHKPIELHILGKLPSDRTSLSAYREYFAHEESCPQDVVFQRMRSADLLVLPTLFEGQALVILEAMASGIPVLVTRASGAEEVVREGVDGWVIEAQSEAALVHRLDWILANRDILSIMGREAAKRAQTYTWESYGSEVLKIIEEMSHPCFKE